ncbi:MAG: exo-alpha-sialidase [Fimbriimonadaceae bacterium]|nr:exo-alpha-sialidase [Fimbriimonadaceae bacterium]
MWCAMLWLGVVTAVPETFDGTALPAGWVTAGGLWQVADGVLTQTDRAAAGAYAWDTRQAWGDGLVRVRFRAAAAGRGVRAAGIVFRAVDSRSGYYVHFDGGNQQVILVRQTAAQSWHEVHRQRQVALPLEAWHQAEVAARGGHFEVRLNGALVASGDDPTFAVGYVGLRAGQGTVSFDDFAVEAAPATAQEFRLMSDPNDYSALPRVAGSSFQAVTPGGFFPVLVTLRDGSLGAVVRGGAPHIGRAGRLDWLHSTDGGRTWSPTRVLVDSGWDDRNPALGCLSDGSLVCAYSEAQSYNAEGKFDHQAGLYLGKVTRSTDGGRTWSAPQPLATEWFDELSPYGRIIELADGTALLPAYSWPRGDGQPAVGNLSRAPGGRPAVLLRSRDQGRTWGDPSIVADGFNEFSVAALPDGRVLAALRDWQGAVSTMESADGGRTWSQPRLVTQPGVHPADVVALDAQTVLLVCGLRLQPKGVVAWLSTDAGRTFAPESRALLAWDALNGDCGYPSVQPLPDGQLAVLYYAVGTVDHEAEQAVCRVLRLSDLRAALAGGAQ